MNATMDLPSTLVSDIDTVRRVPHTIAACLAFRASMWPLPAPPPLRSPARQRTPLARLRRPASPQAYVTISGWLVFFMQASRSATLAAWHRAPAPQLTRAACAAARAQCGFAMLSVGAIRTKNVKNMLLCAPRGRPSPRRRACTSAARRPRARLACVRP